MPAPYCIDPDHFLDLSGAVDVSPEDVKAAWERAYALLELRLQELGPAAHLYIVFGLQGAGKTHWVAQQAALGDTQAIYFSGPLPSRRHRERALALGKRFGCTCIGVWINTGFALAAARNAQRSGLARIKEEAMLHVQENLQAPTLDEGFHKIMILE